VSQCRTSPAGRLSPGLNHPECALTIIRVPHSFAPPFPIKFMLSKFNHLRALGSASISSFRGFGHCQPVPPLSFASLPHCSSKCICRMYFQLVVFVPRPIVIPITPIRPHIPLETHKPKSKPLTTLAARGTIDSICYPGCLGVSPLQTRALDVIQANMRTGPGCCQITVKMATFFSSQGPRFIN